MSPSTRRSLLAAGAAAVGAAVAGCLDSKALSLEAPSPGPGSWPLRRYDAANTGYNPHADPPQSEPEPQWHVETRGGHNGVLVADGTGVAYGAEGIRAFDVATGERLWDDPTGAQAAAIADGTVYAARSADGDRAGDVRSVSLADGTDGWRTTDHGGIRFGQLQVTDDVVTASGRSNDRELVALDRDEGDERWSLETGQSVGLDGTSLYVHGRGALSRYDETEVTSPWDDDAPETVWTTGTNDPLGHNSPAVTDYYVFVGDTAPERRRRAAAASYGRHDGKMRWSAEPRGTWASTPAVADEVGYVAQTERGRERAHVTGIDLLDGGERWHAEIEGSISATLVAGDIVLAWGTTKRNRTGQLLAFDRDGTELWDLEFDAQLSSPVVVAETIFVATADGDLFALETP